MAAQRAQRKEFLIKYYSELGVLRVSVVSHSSDVWNDWNSLDYSTYPQLWISYPRVAVIFVSLRLTIRDLKTIR